MDNLSGTGINNCHIVSLLGFTPVAESIEPLDYRLYHFNAQYCHHDNPYLGYPINHLKTESEMDVRKRVADHQRDIA